MNLVSRLMSISSGICQQSVTLSVSAAYVTAGLGQEEHVGDMFTNTAVIIAKAMSISVILTGGRLFLLIW